MKKLVICEINEEYLKNVKAQMEKQKMPLPKDDDQITIAHKPVINIEDKDLCYCSLCNKIKDIIR